ncbi:hypothetical protein ACHAPT_012890 [Fusarium lateritium]
MARYNLADAIVLGILLAVFYFFQRRRKHTALKDTPKLQASKVDTSRDIVHAMEMNGASAVIFFGSQTGMAEDFASRLAKEGRTRFGLKSMIADLEEYDYDNIDSIPSDKIAIFVMATYGEGEPTDNAAQFHDTITDDNASFSETMNPPLKTLSYAVFGLGNSSYEKFNYMARVVDQSLERLGAHRLGPVGEGDDGKGTMEEDFSAWKESTWAQISQKLRLKELETSYQPSFLVTPLASLTQSSSDVYLGELNSNALKLIDQGPFNSHNPFFASVTDSYELFNSTKRSCLHMEIDIHSSGLTYSTGDHIAIRPTNPNEEVDRLLRVLNLQNQRHQVIQIEALDQTSKVPFPTPTTYDAIFRHYLEICGPVTRSFLATLASFAPSQVAKQTMTQLSRDQSYFKQKATSLHRNLADLMLATSDGHPWPNVPFSVILEGLHKLQPRYYSISSSSLVQPHRVSVTTVVESKEVQGRDRPFLGVTTNYLLSLKRERDGHATRGGYQLQRPRSTYTDIRLPVYIRHSSFRLPADPRRPLILIGPGTGVAPFRGFIQERVHNVNQGHDVGRMLLFFGCRKMSEDMLYENEWEVSSGDLYLFSRLRLVNIAIETQANPRPKIFSHHGFLKRRSRQGIRAASP